MMKKRLILISISLVMVLSTTALLVSPLIQESISWRVSLWSARFRTMLYPPEQVSFSSGVQPAVRTTRLPSEGADALTPQEEKETLAQYDLEPIPPAHSIAEASVTITPPAEEPIPPAHSIAGGTYFSQHNRWNYCGPAAIAMLASYWGWDGTHDEAARHLRTHSLDKNVMPYELADFIREQVGLGAIIRVGGDLDTLKRLIAAGFPVLVEKGPHFRDIHYEITWMGHYQVLSGYNDAGGYFIAQDPYIKPNFHQPYDVLIDEWRSFNYLYLVAYPLHLENDVLNLLGPDADETVNYQNALRKAQSEIYTTSGVQQFFAMFNYGTNLVELRDYAGAAKAYDKAFAMYDALPEDRSVRPYRILWYQTGPFFAYFFTGRYQDVINKATRNSIEMVRDEIPALEESWFWRARAKLMIGDRQGGIEDLYTCLEYRNRWPPCIELLNSLGIYP